ncbi:MAG: sel1 repeat family protein [Gammaproteobacteria bacterium]|nr:sel1 repeat family protein [Gammaproteobacteria bacterium]MDH5802032.1 sel1 repeat family protein [Gammaproteobacteria bacterium]
MRQKSHWVNVIVFSSLFSCASVADYYDEGLVAYTRGDFSQARSHLEKAALKGDVGATHLLAELYAQGKGGAVDTKKSLHWLRQAANAGMASAQFQLGQHYRNLSEYNKAFEWFTVAAAQGYVNAIFYQALLVQHGRVQHSDTDAQQLFSVAASELDVHAQKGHAAAQNNLAYMYETGFGVIANPYKAVAWYERAAQQGLVTAQYNLGRLLALRQDSKEESQYWMQTAAAQGHKEAREFLQSKSQGVALVQ